MNTNNTEELITLHDFDSLLLIDFIEIVISNNYSRLTISGEPTPEQLSAAWEEIVIAYREYLMQATDRHLLRLSCDIDADVAQYHTASLLCDHIEAWGMNPVFTELLAGYGIELNPDNLENDLIAARVELACNKSLIEANREAIAMHQDTGSNSKITRMTFTKTLARLSNFYKREIKIEGLTLATYCVYLKDCFDSQEAEAKRGANQNAQDYGNY